MPYSDKEVDDFWASIDEAASNAPKAPYSHAKVIELIRVAWQLKSQNAKLTKQLAEQRVEVERLQEENEKIKSWVAGYQVQIGSRNQELAELRAEIERLQCQWQPIKTAPRDGTYILLGWFFDGGGGGYPEVAFWHSTKQLWCSSRLLNAEGYYSPTHWMPLPDPPKEV